MKRGLTIWILLLLAGGAQASGGVDSLRCEGRVNPMGIDAPRPVLSWVLTGNERGIRQVAYQVIVSGKKGERWNSGKVTSNRSIGIPYKGKALESREALTWKVRVWTNYGVSAWSAPAHWTMGLLRSSDWTAQWIGYEHGFPWDSVSKYSRLSARYFRKTFDNPQKVRRATLYIVGLGHYEAYINGQRVGDDVLTQIPTDYTKEVDYRTYDVTENITKGANALSVVLGNGRFFTMRPKYKPLKIKEFGFPRLLYQLEITREDGSVARVVSDGSWLFAADGPIRSNNEYDGEEYDATKEPGNWLRPEVLPSWGAALKAQTQDPIRVVDVVHPAGLKEIKPGTWIMDMGRNMAGWVQLKVRGERGTKVTLRFAETLREDGSLDMANLRDARATDVYTLKGEGLEVWHPVFVYHGFQYVSIEGYPGTPALSDFEGQVVSDGLDTLGTWTSSNDLFNRIYANACRSIQSDYKYLPLDCPQRNERMPWLGDRAVGCLGESFWVDNHRLYAQWLDDMEAAQKKDGSLPDVAPAYWNYYSDNMTWPGTYLMVADMLYRQFGDAAPIRKHYASMKRWILYMHERYGPLTKDKYGDWCAPPGVASTGGTLIATAYDAHLLDLMTGFAPLAGSPADVPRWKKMRAVAARAFDSAFAKAADSTATASLLPLVFDLTKDTARLLRTLARYTHVATGVIGTGWLMRGLTDNGLSNLAYRVANNRDYPGWGYMVEQGATTIWERWNGNTAESSMNSRNHVMLLGDLLPWLYEDLAGIKAGTPGFGLIIMKPVCVDSLGFVRASYRTPYGLVYSAWENEPDKWTWHLRIPPNARARVYLPGRKGSLELGSGVYTLEERK
ncbi:alpha-L-rhamnosidase [Dinghuibacter silviterrae]|uniref:alpha-L-rhamnosidase n=1 Tax=Dinghuibacter silviterrae TaxID=1539049 RepID=A0A4R8DTY9_9BACT|nr:alpha-L-rhamnosidase [Dinghuibacter silviterrae]TDX01388.1 alpha-L-rhamnosidase [Dinghuibacter silviterrae]